MSKGGCPGIKQCTHFSILTSSKMLYTVRCFVITLVKTNLQVELKQSESTECKNKHGAWAAARAKQETRRATLKKSTIIQVVTLFLWSFTG